MGDKVTINNQVVSMRKFVKQAKIRAINNYTKEIRKLQNRRGSEDETSKHKRKAERLLSKVEILKKIHPDMVSRKALSKEKDWKAVLKEKNIPLGDQCYALLANYAAVQSEVERFHKKYWDLVPKIATLFKDWEENSKDPVTKQEKNKAKLLRKSMKFIKLDKNNPNATPIGLQNSVSTIKNENIHNKKTPNISLVNVATGAADEQIKNKLVQNSSKPKSSVGINISIKEKTSKNEETKERKFIPRKKSLLKLQIEKKEKKSEEDFDETEMNSEEKDFDETEMNSEEKDFDETEMNSGEDFDETEMYSGEEEFDENQSKDKRNQDLEKKSEDLEMDSENESIASSHELDSYSENNDVNQDENIGESDNDLKTSSVATTGSKKVVKVNRAKHIAKTPKLADKPQDIQARLQAIADNSQKSNMKGNRKLNVKVNTSKKSVSKNNLKAVTMLNLNELQDLDEIPIEKANDIAEEVEENKRKKDPFFLGKGGEVLSESDNEDSANRGQEMDLPAFKKRKFDRKPSEDFFKRRSFPNESSQNPRSNFKEKSFQGNQRRSNFEDRNNSFKNKERQSFDFKDKGFKNKSFGEKFPTKQFKQNAHPEARNKEHFQKNKLNSAINKSTTDDKPLHPSWEAKKKLKEVSKSKFQGKRIVFDD